MALKLSTTDCTRLKFMSETGVKKQDLGAIFGISIATVARYLSEEKRAYSRAVVKNRPRKEHTCYKCGSIIESHPKCSQCKILIHGEGTMCDGCELRHSH